MERIAVSHAIRSDATLGCRLNAYESDAMRELARGAGAGDAVIVNSCAVTAEAVRKSRHAIRRMRRLHPDATLVATGCAVQIDPESFSGMPEIDIVLGNDRKLDPETWRRIGLGDSGRQVMSDIMQPQSGNHLITGSAVRSRAQIQVQNGCDHRCTFCIIPFGRGNSRSVGSEEIIEQVRILVQKGFQEVVLTGVDITSWGEDLPQRQCLGELITAILRTVPGLPRLRVSSVDPVELDDIFTGAMASEERLVPHLHLSVQSGDNLILKRMKRRHQREDVIELCAGLRRMRPEIVFGADIIAGFPTESDTHFENTRRLIDECGLTWLHVFPYSRRYGTPAARMPQIDAGVIRGRAEELRRIGAECVRRFLAGQIGRRTRLLMETPRVGRTAQFALAELSEDQRRGSIIDARVTASDGERLRAEPIH
ncbi:MAG: tRNA (N(6)-L-threonylcarbamoyladenosine(37)-C(2))-methylthiotransferase MtaB [Rhodobacteraceae bacterium]|nr:tRNA (N(6)-L-threonylcarbamoyladenosine(37)-C(2))-methylthiotransferase MtaB [Paracoccaceae bacterium]